MLNVHIIHHNRVDEIYENNSYELFPIQVDEQPFGHPLIIEDMPHMAQFVYDFYQEKLQVLHAKLGVSICHLRLIPCVCQTWVEYLPFLFRLIACFPFWPICCMPNVGEYLPFSANPLCMPNLG